MNQYIKNYRALGIQPGCSWNQLRRAYKSLVNTWHPDRFQQDVHRRKLAEEKTKEITQSYSELAEYYKKFGVLPVAVNTDEIPVAEDIPENDKPGLRPASESPSTEPAAAVVTSIPPQRSWLPTFVFRVISAVALAGSAYFFWQFAPSEQNDNSPAMEQPTDSAADAENEEDSNRQTVPEPEFTIGSSVGEVYSIQGVPTKTENNIWYYGNSKVYFVNGRVSRWEESDDNPLRVRITPRKEKSVAKFFGKGSSKEDVLAAQGAPDQDAGTVWDYGSSRVYFEKDRVTGWNDTPLNPLKARR